MIMCVLIPYVFLCFPCSKRQNLTYLFLMFPNITLVIRYYKSHIHSWCFLILPLSSEIITHVFISDVTRCYPCPQRCYLTSSFLMFPDDTLVLGDDNSSPHSWCFLTLPVSYKLTPNPLKIRGGVPTQLKLTDLV